MTISPLALTRRGALAAIVAVIAARQAEATPEAAREWLAGLTKGTPQDAKVTLKAPEIAENGMAVPLTVSVDSEMSDKSYVKALYIVADGNPRPGIATFHLTPLSGKATAATRIRLQTTENIIVVAKTNDGKFFTDRKQVKVTIGGCGG